MNEQRIKSFADHADRYAYSISDSDPSVNWYTVRDQKFAELLIRECANYIKERTLDWDADLRWIFNDGSGDMAVDVDDLLNRHFGIEE
jgi:hypothetical protein